MHVLIGVICLCYDSANAGQSTSTVAFDGSIWYLPLLYRRIEHLHEEVWWWKIMVLKNRKNVNLLKSFLWSSFSILTNTVRGFQIYIIYCLFSNHHIVVKLYNVRLLDLLYSIFATLSQKKSIEYIFFVQEKHCRKIAQKHRLSVLYGKQTFVLCKFK